MRVNIETIQEAQRLFATGQWSQRRLASYFGIARATVKCIVEGRYTLRVRQHEEHQSTLFDETLPPQRCSGCGGNVYMPCHLCHVRRLKHRATIRPLLRTAA